MVVNSTLLSYLVLTIAFFYSTFIKNTAHYFLLTQPYS